MNNKWKLLYKLKIIFVNLLALLNTFEGLIHLVVAVIGFWGIYDTKIFDWRLLIAPMENLVFGLFSIATGYYLKKFGKTRGDFNEV